MCMEDIRIGRKSNSQLRVISVPLNAQTLILSASVNRISATISGDGLNPMWVYVRGATALFNVGLLIPALQKPLELTFENVGSLVYGEWLASAGAATVTATVVDTTLTDK